MNVGIIVAGGKSQRMGSDVDKAFLSLGTKPVLAYSVDAYERCQDIDSIVLVVRKDRLNAARGMVQMFGFNKVEHVIVGGTQRQASVQNGLDVLDDDVKVVSVHDGARPCLTPDVISETIKAAKRYGSGVAAVKITDTVKEVQRGVTVSKTIDRTKLWAVQTPQTFKIDLLQKAFDNLKKKKTSVTDEAMAVELINKDVRLVPACLSNIKITTPDDMRLAGALLKLN